MRPLRRRTALLTTALLLAAAACGSDGDSPAPAASDDPSTTTAAPTTTTVPAGAVVEEAGAQPRQPLVLKVAAATTARVALVNKVGITLVIDGAAAPSQPAPATRMVIEQRVNRVDPDGTVHYSVTFSDVTVVSTPGLDPAVARSVQTALNQLKGIRGTGSLDAQGDGKEFTVDTAGVTDATLKSTIDSASSQVGNLSTPFPKEPVGVGARWTVKRSATLNGLVLETTTRYTLRSRSGDRYELDVTQDAVSPPGPAAIPNLPAGARASVTSFSLQSKGQITGDLTRPMPVRSSMTGAGDGTFALTAGTERHTLRQQMTVELSTSPA